MAHGWAVYSSGGTAAVKEDGDQITAAYLFAGGSCAAVEMTQPYGENGIWVPQKIVSVPEDIVWEEQKDEMNQYLTFRFPESVVKTEFPEEKRSGEKSIFGTTDTAKQQRLNELAECIDKSTVPEEWYSAGCSARYIPQDTSGWRFAGENLMEVTCPWGNSEFLTEFISVSDCEAPAVVVLARHILKENQSSRMWYVFFAKPDCRELYSIALNADLFSQENILKVARSVHFTGEAWTELPILDGNE